MAAITHIGHDEFGFPKPLLASVKLLLFVALLPILFLGVPVALGTGLYHLVA